MKNLINLLLSTAMVAFIIACDRSGNGSAPNQSQDVRPPVTEPQPPVDCRQYREFEDFHSIMLEQSEVLARQESDESRRMIAASLLGVRIGNEIYQMSAETVAEIFTWVFEDNGMPQSEYGHPLKKQCSRGE